MSAILTGCDKITEWMLPWWYEHLSRFNKLPIFFADFGMTPVGRSWCELRGTILNLSTTVPGWFKKPEAILACPSDRILWLDTDCEVRGDVSRAFIYGSGRLAGVVDPYNRWCADNPKAINTGVLVVSEGNRLIREWATACEHTKLRGDQEVLSVITKGRDCIDELPQKFNWLRLAGDSADAIIMHWTGPAGKTYIKRDHCGGF